MASQCFDTFLYMLTNIYYPDILVSLKPPMDVQSSDCQFPSQFPVSLVAANQ